MKSKRRNNPIFITGMLVFSILLTLSGCGAKQSSPVVSVKSSDGSALISVPSNWNAHDKSLSSVFPTAEIAASDSAEDEHFVVIKKPKSGYPSTMTLDKFTDGLGDTMNRLVTDPVWGPISKITINGLSGRSSKLTGTGKATGTPYVYLVNALEDRNNYNIVVGYLIPSKVNADMALISNITKSFKASS